MFGDKYLKRIDELISKEIENKTYSGVAASAVLNGKVLFEGAWGMADLEKKIKMQENSIFRIHSLSKVITSAAVMQLIERGRLDIGFHASWFFDGFKNPMVATENGLVKAKREVTIGDLLNMTSGCAYPDGGFKAGEMMGSLYYEAEQSYKAGKPFSTSEMIDRIGKVPLAFQPGERWLYGTSADILGGIIEKAADKPYDEYLRDEIFAPLGMEDTGFYVPDDKKNRFTQLYDYPNGEPKPFESSFLGLYDYDKRPAFISGGAGVVSTIRDYRRFASMLSCGGEYDGVRILSPKAVEFMGRNTLTDAQKITLDWDSCRGYGYGNLVRVLENPSIAGTLAPVGEFGWDGWAGAYACCNPCDRLAFVLFVQRCGAGTTDIARRVKNIVLSSL